MTTSLPETNDRPTRWREPRRFLLATVAITLLYLGIQAFWMWGAAELAHVGWTVNDPARTYADEAAEIAEKSRQREAALDPHFPRQVFQLGFEYGYLSQWLGGYGQQPDEVMRQLSRPGRGKPSPPRRTGPATRRGAGRPPAGAHRGRFQRPDPAY